jgi:signal transduction histidine kinase
MKAQTETLSAEGQHETDIMGGPLPARLPELLRSIIQWAVELMRVDAGEILLWDPERGVLEQAISIGFMEVYDGVVLRPGEGMGGKVFQSGQPMFVPDYAAWEGRAAGYDSSPPFLATFGVPLKWQDEIVGVLEMDADSRRRAFDQDDIRLATLFANVATLAIKNAQSYEDLQRRSQELQRSLEREVAHRTAELRHRALQLETSAGVSREITAILDIDKLLTRVVELIHEAFDYYSVLVFLVDTQANQLVLNAASGEIGRQMVTQGLVLPIDGNSLNSTAVSVNEALIANDVSQEPRFRITELLADTRSELVIPLRVGARVIGTLDVQSDKRNAFAQEDMLVVQSLGDQIAIAIENAHLYDRSRELAILEERTRLARELHDSVAQSLFSIDLSARAVATYLRQDRQKAEEELYELRRTAHGALREMRSLIYDLRPVSLEDLGLVSALRQEVKRLRRTQSPELVLQEIGSCSLPVSVEQDLFRIAQEALRNAVKHAHARQIVVAVIMGPESVELCVKDDGRGFDPEALMADSGRSFGLIGLRERAKRIKGSLEIVSQPGAGTQVRVRVPAQAEGKTSKAAQSS